MRYTPIVCLSLSLILWPSLSLPPPEHHTAIAILLPPTKTAKIERKHPTLIIGTTLRSKFPPSPQDDGSVPPAVPERAIPRNIHIPSLPRTQSKNDTVIYVNGVGGQYGGGSGSDFDVGIRRRLHVPLVSSWWKEYYLRKFDGEEELNARVNLSPPLSYSLLAHIKPSLQSDPYSDCRGIICSVEDVRVPTEDGSFCFSSRISLCPVTSMGIDPGFVSEFDGGGVGSGISGGGNSLQVSCVRRAICVGNRHVSNLAALVDIFSHIEQWHHIHTVIISTFPSIHQQTIDTGNVNDYSSGILGRWFFPSFEW